jgi:hypothetical protein
MIKKLKYDRLQAIVNICALCRIEEDEEMYAKDGTVF